MKGFFVLHKGIVETIVYEYTTSVRLLRVHWCTEDTIYLRPCVQCTVHFPWEYWRSRVSAAKRHDPT